MMAELGHSAQQVADHLKRLDQRLVLAESCTCGLIAATLGLVPGISQYLCGSAVVYREQTKIDWLAVAPATLDAHTAVSQQASDEIARGALQNTVEAKLSLGITGHFGPNAPDGLDGVIFLSVWSRANGEPEHLDSSKQTLSLTKRAERQTESATLALQFLGSVLARS